MKAFINDVYNDLFAETNRVWVLTPEYFWEQTNVLLLIVNNTQNMNFYLTICIFEYDSILVMSLNIFFFINRIQCE